MAPDPQEKKDAFKTSNGNTTPVVLDDIEDLIIDIDDDDVSGKAVAEDSFSDFGTVSQGEAAEEQPDIAFDPPISREKGNSSGFFGLEDSDLDEFDFGYGKGVSTEKKVEPGELDFGETEHTPFEPESPPEPVSDFDDSEFTDFSGTDSQPGKMLPHSEPSEFVDSGTPVDLEDVRKKTTWTGFRFPVFFLGGTFLLLFAVFLIFRSELDRYFFSPLSQNVSRMLKTSSRFSTKDRKTVSQKRLNEKPDAKPLPGNALERTPFEKKTNAFAGDLRQTRLTKGLKRLNAILAEIRKKNEEMHTLKRRFNEKIDRSVSDLGTLLRKFRITSYHAAVENESINFCIRTIMRRTAFLREVEKISDQLGAAMEDIRYTGRLARIEMSLAGASGKIDLQALGQTIENKIGDYETFDRKIRFAIRDTDLEKPEIIWKKYVSVRRNRSGKKEFFVRQMTNREIQERICEKDFEKIYLLTVLSEKTAECISHWNGKDLNLGGIRTLTPEAAFWLAKWKGDWIILNGLTELTPDTAKYLFQWKGTKLSLNGLLHLSPEVLTYISAWNGNDLELIGLKYLAKKRNNYMNKPSTLEILKKWEAKKRNLFLSGELREKMENRIAVK